MPKNHDIKDIELTDGRTAIVLTQGASVASQTLV